MIVATYSIQVQRGLLYFSKVCKSTVAGGIHVNKMDVKRTVLGEPKMTCGPFTMLFLFEPPSVTSLPSGDVDELKVTLFLFESPPWTLVLVDSGLLGTKNYTVSNFPEPVSAAYVTSWTVMWMA